MSYAVKINADWCKICKVCIDFCPKNVLYISAENQVAVKDRESCTGCMMCEYRCPDYAIRVEAN
ncbi:4Fe-4S dicluster domain-containing protein [Candidatus Formimonas warabiya]|uniref:4Fe-4S ferredoxin-type domain-containing protein n=1 Tax=Formimonas warabiya TaxID=1761012 RepID=A0A3G1KLW3_FORW1|nr:4Fe-4S binding protein [Candidatus Formimonas warabiya]ATW23466.1 hypothetical protein DCMF_00435 [Candidatus Formimonas warabiya]